MATGAEIDVAVREGRCAFAIAADGLRVTSYREARRFPWIGPARREDVREETVPLRSIKDIDLLVPPDGRAEFTLVLSAGPRRWSVERESIDALTRFGPVLRDAVSAALAGQKARRGGGGSGGGGGRGGGGGTQDVERMDGPTERAYTLGKLVVGMVRREAPGYRFEQAWVAPLAREGKRLTVTFVADRPPPEENRELREHFKRLEKDHRVEFATDAVPQREFDQASRRGHRWRRLA